VGENELPDGLLTSEIKDRIELFCFIPQCSFLDDAFPRDTA